MATNRRDLKSYVRYDGSGRIIPGSNVLRKNMPKVGKWKQTQAYQCCNTPVPPSEPFNIEQFFSRMNNCYEQVTSLVPEIVYFTDRSYDEFSSPTYLISNGCDDMYDSGNLYNTNLTQLYVNIKEDNVNENLSIPYTHTQDPNNNECNYTNPLMDGVIANGSSYFGAGSQYFTNMYPGMFIIAANNVSVSEFSITGNIGSDGYGVNAVYIVTAHPGWTAFVKTNYDTNENDPSVNHIILVYGNVSGVTQLYDNTGSYDDHCLQGLSSQNTAIITTVVATEAGTPALTQEQALAIANKILDVYKNEECETPPPQALRLTFDNIENADLLVGDSSDVNDWNTFFDLPNLGTAFTSVQILGNEVQLFGGSNIKVKPALMYDYNNNTFLISVIDDANCITSVGGDAFSYCDGLITVDLSACIIVYGSQDSPQNDYGGFGFCSNLINLNIPLLQTAGDYAFGYCNSLTTVDLPNLTTASNSCFQDCTSLTTINLPLLTSAGDFCFAGCTSLTTVDLPSLTNAGNLCFWYCSLLETIDLPLCTNLGSTVGDDGVFDSLSGNNVTLTIPAALMTADAGNPDGDIQYLEANNTVTITYV